MTQAFRTSVFTSLEDLFGELADALSACAQAAPANSDEAVEFTLLSGEAAGRAADVRPAAGEPFEDRIGAHRTFLDGLRRRFEKAAAALGGAPERTAAQRLFDGLDNRLQEAEQGPGVQTLASRASFVPPPTTTPQSDLDDLVAYPVLTTETGGGGTLAGGGGGMGGGTGTGQVQRTVELAVRQVLGRLPKYTDATAFTAALTATFELRMEQGHTEAVWRPRGFVGQTELGGSVSGAQASLYARASDALAATIPVLHGLTALRSDADIQEMDAARSVVESQFNALVVELGTPGGARAARVDGLFNVLLREQVFGLDPDPVQGGMLGYLGDVFGLEQSQVNTIEEEQVFSNFLLIRDYIEAIEVSWRNFRGEFDGRDLGTSLVLLSNALQVVAESVDEVTAALDSVFVGAAERTVARFSTASRLMALDGQDSGPMLVSELLAWISAFATQEAPELVQQAGRRGMGPIVSTGSTLVGLVGSLSAAIAAGGRLPVGMSHPRVQYPLTELRTYLGEVVRLADGVQRVPAPSR